MVRSRLTKVDGSVMLTLPPSILQACRLDHDALVNIWIDPSTGLVVLKPANSPYTLDELLAQCDELRPCEDCVWPDAAATDRAAP